MEGASASLCAVSPPDCPGQKQGHRRNRHRTRDDRFHLGDRPPGPTAVSVATRIGHATYLGGQRAPPTLLQAPKAGGRIRWGTLVACYEPIKPTERSLLEGG